MINFLSNLSCILLLLAVTGCFGAKAQSEHRPVLSEAKARIAVLPIENLSGLAAPLKDIRGAFIERLARLGVSALEDDALNRFMARNRVRYTGGLNPDSARAFKAEEKVDAVLVTSLELYDENLPPKLSLSARLVSVDDDPKILWMDSVGLSGDDAPGLLSLGMIEDPVKLRSKALDNLTDSLRRNFLRTDTVTGGKRTIRNKPPKIVYRSAAIKPEGPYSVVVAPFLNESERKNAGEIVALLFVEQLKKAERFKVVEPGVVRQELLNLRIIMDGGLSLANTDALFSTIEADLIVMGKVFSYQDYHGAVGTPKVDFSAVVLEKKSRKVVWSSGSYGQGNDGVYLFDFGRINNAHAMASNMVGTIIRLLLRD